MSDKSFRTLAGPASAHYSESGSRFFAFAFPVMKAVEIDTRKAELVRRFPDATHHCYAWRYNPIQPQEFTQDDGEPGGTAGQPILGVIKSEQLINVMIMVVRYFGGKKLGIPGLIHAYREAAARAVAEARKTTLYQITPLVIHYPYDLENRIRGLINRFQLTTVNEQYQVSVTITVHCRSDKTQELQYTLDHLAYRGVRYESLPDCFRTTGN